MHLHTRRFVCRVPWCRRKIFAERVPALVAPSARRTARLQHQLVQTGFDLGGEAGARRACAAGTPVSARTLLRLVRATPLPAAGPVRILGVDDWARRKGRTYGTILVNLETHTVIDLLEDRTAATLAAWLEQHPEVEIISRDRAGAYAEGARQGAPQAQQVADRFHLRKNVSDALERYLTRQWSSLRRAAQEAPPEPESTGTPGDPVRPLEPGVLTAVQEAPPAPAKRLTRHEQAHQESRARRLQRYEEVCALRVAGHSVRRIAAHTHLAKGTVLRYLRAPSFPEAQPRPGRARQLTRFVPLLRQRWEAGCHNAKELWQEMRTAGFTGAYSVVADYLRAWRQRPAQALAVRTVPLAPLPAAATARQTAWLLLGPAGALSAAEDAYLQRVLRACPLLLLAQALAREFATILETHDVDGFYAWLHGMEICPIREFRAVGERMRQDRHAIEAAVRLDWSNGQVEGQVNRLKVIKRQGYGRSGFALLRRRVLHRAS